MTQSIEIDRAREEILLTPVIEAAPPDEHPAIVMGKVLLERLLSENEPDTLDRWREIIDITESNILSWVAARVLATERIGKHKVERGISGVDGGRELTVINRTADFGDAIGVKKAALIGLELALIEKAHSQHSEARRDKSA